MTSPIAEVVERNVDPGIGLFEIVDDPELAGVTDWDIAAGPIRFEPGRIGLLTAGRYYQPEIVMRAWLQAPPSPPRRPDVVATTRHEAIVVSLPRHQVEVWGGEVTPGTVKLRLPDRFGDRYWVRVTVDELADHPGQSIDEYVEPLAIRGETVIGIERFTVDLWPATPEIPDSTTVGSQGTTASDSGEEDSWVDPIEQPGRIVDHLEVIISDPADRVLEVVDDPDRIEIDYTSEALEMVTVLPGRVRYMLPTQRPIEVVLNVFSGPPDTNVQDDRKVLDELFATFVTRDIYLWSLTEIVGPVGLPQPWTSFQIRITRQRGVTQIEVWPSAP